MNPASSGWRPYARERLSRNVYGVDGEGRFDGLFLDNINMRLYKFHHQVAQLGRRGARVQHGPSRTASRRRLISHT